MTDFGSRAPRRRPGYAWLAAGPVAAAGAIAMFIAAQPAVAATAPVGLGTAGSFAVLAGQTVTNTGLSMISGDLGVSPGTAVTGFPPGLVIDGAIHSADGVAAGAQSDLTTAYNDAAGRSQTASVSAFIGAGQTLAPGVYKASSTLDVGGSLTLDAGGDPDAVFIFQVPSKLVTDSASSVILTNGAQACNVFWQVGSSATLGTHSAFTGTILALTSISVTTGDTIAGRALARNGSVTLDDDTITAPSCSTTTTPTPTPTATTPTPTPTATTPAPTQTATTPAPTQTATTPAPTQTATTPAPRGTMPTPTQTATTPAPRGTMPTQTATTPAPTGTTPTPTQTATTPTQTATSPSPSPTSPTPVPAPIPTPVGNNFPVTG
jgi:hypothetical protein